MTFIFFLLLVRLKKCVKGAIKRCSFIFSTCQVQGWMTPFSEVRPIPKVNDYHFTMSNFHLFCLGKKCTL